MRGRGVPINLRRGEREAITRRVRPNRRPHPAEGARSHQLYLPGELARERLLDTVGASAARNMKLLQLTVGVRLPWLRGRPRGKEELRALCGHRSLGLSFGGF